MDIITNVPPGFRFHPTDEELVDYYLRRKVASRRIDLDIIKEVDLYKIEPWDLHERCRIGTEEQDEWYFFSHKDKKYPTGTRTNRATAAGFWKATGRDKPIHSGNSLIGMRKTLVFYKGRAPNGQKSDWIIHEYRLETNEDAPPQEEGWVVCRAFIKRVAATVRRESEQEAACWFDNVLFTQHQQPAMVEHHHLVSCGPEQELHSHPPFLQLPQLESPRLPVYCYSSHAAVLLPSGISLKEELIQSNKQLQVLHADYSNTRSIIEEAAEQMPDWRILDKIAASQLHHDANCNCSNSASDVLDSEKHEANAEYAST